MASIAEPCYSQNSLRRHVKTVAWCFDENHSVEETQVGSGSTSVGI
jgi:hypothetical protein